MWTIFSLLVENKPGILFEITHLFRARNFNIDSISVGVTDNPGISRMTITTSGNQRQLAQVEKQLGKVIDIIEVRRLDRLKTVYRELAIFKIRISSAKDSMEVNSLINAYGARAHDVQRDSIMAELTSTPDQIQAFEELAREFGIIEMVRTGIAALQRSKV